MTFFNIPFAKLYFYHIGKDNNFSCFAVSGAGCSAGGAESTGVNCR